MLLLVFAVALSVVLADLVPLPPPPGYMMTAQFRCNESHFDCQSWTLDVVRQDYFVFKNETIPMQYLEPPAPKDETMYQVLTALNNDTHEFYVTAARPDKKASLWEVVFDGLVETSEIVNQSTIAYPSNATSLVRIHAAPGGVLVAIFDNGDVYNVDAQTGALAWIGTVLPVQAKSAWVVTQASTVNYEANTLYSVAYKTSTSNATSAHIVTLDLSSGKSTIEAMTGTGPVKGNPWQYEMLFHALWIPIMRQVVVFAHAIDMLGRDQILWVEPSTGNVTAWEADLGDKGYYFTNIPGFRVDDMKQAGFYDYLDQKVYFECSQNPAEATVVAYLDVLAQGVPPTVQFTFTGFGFMGFEFIPTQASN